MVDDWIIVGAGPAGLSAAIACRANDLTYRVLEKGMLVNSIAHFPTQMQFFSTTERLEIAAIPFITSADHPTRSEVLRYYRRVVDDLELNVHLYTRVESAARRPDGLFEVHTVNRTGQHDVHQSRRLLLSTGCFDNPNRLGVPGEDLGHVSHYYHEAHPYFRQKLIIVGASNAAAEAALECWRQGARVTIVHRGAGLGSNIKPWVMPDILNRVKRGEIATHFQTVVREIREQSVLVDKAGVGTAELAADSVLLLTGHHPDLSLALSLGAAPDPEQGGLRFDADTLETTVPGLHVAGILTAGRDANKVFIENGRHHGPRIIEALVGRSAPRAS